MIEKKTVISGSAWRFGESISSKMVSFVVSVILARLLEPAMYGTIAIVNAFISIMQVFIDSGMGNALIQKKNADDLDFSSVFYFNMGMCSVLYIGLFFCAPIIADFYKMPELTSIIRVLGVTVIVSGVKNVQYAYISRNILFKHFFFATLGGTLGSAIVGIGLAWAGFGVWALVAQSLFNTCVDTVVLWATVKWRPRKLFSFYRLRGLFSFGWKLLASGLVDKVYRNLNSLIIGKLYSSDDLAFYDKAQHLPSLATDTLVGSIDSVLLPTMSERQDDRIQLRAMTMRAIKTSVYLASPVLIGLFVCAEPVVRLLLTEKWLQCVPFIRITCVASIFLPIHTVNLNVIKSLGRSDLFLKAEVWKKIIGLLVIVFTVRFGVLAIAYGGLITEFFSQIINTWPNRKLLNYSYAEQLKDILPETLLGVFMGACVYCVQFLHLNDWLTLLIQVPLGGVIYIGLSKLFKLESFEYIIGILKDFISSRKERKRTI